MIIIVNDLIFVAVCASLALFVKISFFKHGFVNIQVFEFELFVRSFILRVNTLDVAIYSIPDGPDESDVITAPR